MGGEYTPSADTDDTVALTLSEIEQQVLDEADGQEPHTTTSQI
ncbi:hypothetical protein [Umezawaea sp. Da 62-37]|nr:hypothetical protein [Umezawaea sp. Da 62-37]WNV87877.1 hypothetical protein RM788_06220 [Umezawaea sp. Da 62-37]